MGWWNKINCAREKFSIQEISSNKGKRQSVEEPLPKEKREKRHSKSWEKFISRRIWNIQNKPKIFGIYKAKPNTFKPLKHTNKDIKESAYTNHGPSKEIFLHYYKESLANNSLQENYWKTENADDGIITMEIESTKKNWKSPGEDNSNSELYKYTRGSFNERQLFF